MNHGMLFGMRTLFLATLGQVDSADRNLHKSISYWATFAQAF